MKSLIVGYGEVGKALCKVLVDYAPASLDPKDKHLTGMIQISGPRPPDEKETFEIMHITFPYSPNFIQYVKEYQEKYKPRFTVIHSTVPLGTSRELGATHSPIRGIHPNLEGGIRTFTKFLGGEQSSDVADYFRRAGIRVALFDKQETTEAMKLWDTQYYKVVIDFAHRVKRYCDKHNLNFHEVYTLANQTYNEGYTKLGIPEVVRPVLQPIMKPIGGHCLLPNDELLKESE